MYKTPLKLHPDLLSLVILKNESNSKTRTKIDYKEEVMIHINLLDEKNKFHTQKLGTKFNS